MKGVFYYSSVYVNEVTSGKSLRMGSLLLGELTLIRGLELSAPTQPPETEDRLESQSITSGQ